MNKIHVEAKLSEAVLLDDAVLIIEGVRSRLAAVASSVTYYIEHRRNIYSDLAELTDFRSS